MKEKRRDSKGRILHTGESQRTDGKYHIPKAANGTEALEILAKQEVDLIVSDVMMPEMDGMEL